MLSVSVFPFIFEWKMNYSQTLDFLYSQLPMFQRVGSAAYKADLSNTIALCKAAGNPEKKLTFIHVAGTNGKGSTSHLLASVFQEAGYKTGLYTSPHLKDFRERIKVDGKMISKKFVVDFTEEFKKQIKKINPSFFEMTVVMAFKYFEKQKTDINIIEVGMGGRLDSTNVIMPEISVITTISKDHVQFLGNDLRSIAREKGGIIKKGVPVVKAREKSLDTRHKRIANSHKPIDIRHKPIATSHKAIDKRHKYIDIGRKTNEVVDVLQKMAKEKKSEFILAPTKLKKKYECELKGDYQKMNIATVVTAITELQKKGWKIKEKNIKAGIAKVVTNTGLMGRWQILNKKPLTICDIGHNEEGIKEIIKGIKKIKYDHLHFVIGVVNDKDVSAMLSLLPKNARYYFCQAKIQRAMKKEELKELAKKFGLKGDIFGSVKKALLYAQKTSTKNDLVFVGGSAFVVAEIVS